jgi:hypothetical protein
VIHTVPPRTTSFFLPGRAYPDVRFEHPQVALYHAPRVYGDGERSVVYVDLLMADPLLRMWQAGIATTWSCQGNAAPGWINSGYCVISDPARTYEAVKIIGTAFNTDQFRFDSLRFPDHPAEVGEVIRWNRPRVREEGFEPP